MPPKKRENAAVADSRRAMRLLKTFPIIWNNYKRRQ